MAFIGRVDSARGLLGPAGRALRGSGRPFLLEVPVGPRASCIFRVHVPRTAALLDSFAGAMEEAPGKPLSCEEKEKVSGVREGLTPNSPLSRIVGWLLCPRPSGAARSNLSFFNSGAPRE